MAWTAPLTVADGDVLTAATFNATVRDNMLATEAAKATAAGQLLVSSAANEIVAVAPKAHSVATSESTTSTSYVGLTTAGPTVTLDTGTKALVFINAAISNDNSDAASLISFTVSGATTLAADDTRAARMDGIAKTSANRVGMCVPVTLNAGSNTFTMRYKAGSGRALFSDRSLAVLPL